MFVFQPFFNGKQGAYRYLSYTNFLFLNYNPLKLYNVDIQSVYECGVEILTTNSVEENTIFMELLYE